MDWEKIILAVIAMITGSYGVWTGYLKYKKDVKEDRNKRDNRAWETMEKQYHNLEKRYNELSDQVTKLEKKLDEFRKENSTKDQIILEKERIIMKKDAEIEDHKDMIRELRKTNQRYRVKIAELGGDTS